MRRRFDHHELSGSPDHHARIEIGEGQAKPRPATAQVTDMAEAVRDTHHIVSRPQFRVRHTVAEDCAFLAHAHASYTVTTVLAGRLHTTVGLESFELVEGETGFTGIGVMHSAGASRVEFVSVGLA